MIVVLIVNDMSVIVYGVLGHSTSLCVFCSMLTYIYICVDNVKGFYTLQILYIVYPFYALAFYGDLHYKGQM